MEAGYSEGIALEGTNSGVASTMLRKQEESRHASLGIQFEAYDSREESSRIRW